MLRKSGERNNNKKKIIIVEAHTCVFSRNKKGFPNENIHCVYNTDLVLMVQSIILIHSIIAIQLKINSPNYYLLYQLWLKKYSQNKLQMIISILDGKYDSGIYKPRAAISPNTDMKLSINQIVIYRGQCMDIYYIHITIVCRKKK